MKKESIGNRLTVDFQLCQLEIRFSPSPKEKKIDEAEVFYFYNLLISKEVEASEMLYEIKTHTLEACQVLMTGLHFKHITSIYFILLYLFAYQSQTANQFHFIFHY